MKLRCLVVDDEPIAQQILEKYIAQVEALQLVAKCSNAFAALEVLRREQIDLMFLDIKMPSLSGLEMLKTLQQPPRVILTTAFSEFAVESYEYGVVDYLVKPVPFERFLRAVNRILIPQNATFLDVPPAAPPIGNNDFIFFKADKKIYKFYLKDLLFVEGSGNYVKIHHVNGSPLLILDKISELLKKLPAQQFLRVHKSYIVNVAQIGQIEGNRIKIADKVVPISASYKQAFEAFIQGRG